MSEESSLQTTKYLIQFASDLQGIKVQLESTGKHLDNLQAQTLENTRQLNHQNELLAEHIKGVQTNAERLSEERESRILLNEQFTNRIGKLEEGPQFRVTLTKFIIQIAAVTTSAGVILGVFLKVAEIFNVGVLP